MRHTFLLVAALGLIAATGPSALAQESDKTTSPPATPTTSEPATQQPATLPGTVAQPATSGQVISPYAPVYTGGVTPCGGIMPSAPIPGTVQYGSQFPQYQPFAQYGSFPQTMIPPTPYGLVTYGQPGIQPGQPTAMPVAGSVAGGVIAQPYQSGQLQMNGTTFSGVTYQPYQSGLVLPSGMTSQPIQSGMVFQTGAMGPYSDQPVILTGFSDGSYVPVTTTTQSGRRGLFGRRR
jgi:hypothetical protein